MGALGDTENAVDCLMSAAELARNEVRPRAQPGCSLQLMPFARRRGYSLHPVEEELRARIMAAVGEDAAPAAAQSEGRAMSLDDAPHIRARKHEPI